MQWWFVISGESVKGSVWAHGTERIRLELRASSCWGRREGLEVAGGGEAAGILGLLSPVVPLAFTPRSKAVTVRNLEQNVVQSKCLFYTKNFTKWAAGCTKTFGEGWGGESLFKKATRTVVTVTRQERSGGGWGTGLARPSLRAHACTLLACR